MSAILIIFLLLGYSSADNLECYSGEDEVRLVGGPNDFEGRVEVCLEGVWRRWCRSSGNVDAEAAVVCRQLGHGRGGGVLDTAFHGVGDGSEFISNVSCPGEAEEITNCDYDTATVMGPGDCNDVAIACEDTSCTNTQEEPILTTNTQGLVELCDGDFRNGLCYENFTMETATVLCRQQGLNASNPDFAEVEDIHYFRTYNNSYSCTGNEQQFSECTLSIVRIGTQLCSSVRLNCVGNETFEQSDPTSGAPATALCTTRAPATNTATNTTTVQSDAVVPIIPVVASVVVCVVLALLSVVAIVILVLCARKTRRSKVSREKPTLENSGMALSNITYDSSSRLPNKKVDERTVHNDLYTQQEIPVTTPPHIYDYAAVGVTQGQPSQPVPQHTLLHSTHSTSDADSHAYSKPATPISNYDRTDRTGNSLTATPNTLGCPTLPTDNCNSYSRLNSHVHSQQDSQPQNYSEVGGGQEQYSQIDNAHKYAKLSDNSKGYSQLGTCETQAATSAAAAATEQQTQPHHELAQPYEVPFSPGAQSSTPSGPADHAYSTLSVEDDSMSGYSRLRVVEGSFQQGTAGTTSATDHSRALLSSGAGGTGVDHRGRLVSSEMEDNNAYESASLDRELVAAHYEIETVPGADNITSP